MRHLWAVLVGCLILGLAGVAGCSDSGKAKIPEKTIELPKDGPTPAGGGAPGKKAAPPSQSAS
jgi:hypothetical protein